MVTKEQKIEDDLGQGQEGSQKIALSMERKGTWKIIAHEDLGTKRKDQHPLI